MTNNLMDIDLEFIKTAGKFGYRRFDKSYFGNAIIKHADLESKKRIMADMEQKIDELKKRKNQSAKKWRLNNPQSFKESQYRYWAKKNEK